MNWNTWKDAYNGRSRRERLVLWLLAPVLLWLLLDMFWLSSLQLERGRLELRLVELASQKQALTATLQQLETRLQQDPDAERHQQLQGLDRKIADAEQQLQQLKARFIAPDLMPTVLQQTLKAHAGIQLVRVTKLPSEAIGLEPDPNASAANATTARPEVDALLYRHPLRLELTGGYAEVQAYLQALEQLPWQFYWRKLDYQVEAYPQARIILEIYTLSATQEWLSV